MKTCPDNEVLILDFDQTLFLSNSTEEYLISAQPKFLVSLILTLLSWLRLWNFLPGENKRMAYNDAIRIIFISIIFPWSYFLFKNRVKDLSEEYLNTEIQDLIKSKPWKKVIIASNGFNFIINPLLIEMGIKPDLILSSNILLNRQGIRAVGKRKFIENHLDPSELEKSTFISDNLEDKGIGEIVNEYIFYENENAQRPKAGKDSYFPFVYTHKSKRGNSNHLLNVVILQDYPFILLAYGFSNPINAKFFIFIFILLLSFWCIYEACYFENDLHELRFESKHDNLEKLHYIEAHQDSPIEFQAWIWSILLSLLGFFILEFRSLDSYSFLSYSLGKNLLGWVIFLLISRLIFRTYTYSPIHYRVGISPFLQITRLAGPALFLSINFCGAFFIISRVLSRWISYSINRAEGDRKAISQALFRNIIFIILISTVAFIEKDLKIFTSLQFILILCFSLLRGNFSLFKNLYSSIKS